MFTGIIEDLGTIIRTKREGGNVHVTVQSVFQNELQVDQSVAHNGVCLTVVALTAEGYIVTAIQETLKRSNLASWRLGDRINLERCTKVGERLDGHIVQGHVDATAALTHIEDCVGSWKMTFQHDRNPEFMTVAKGSITVNGISLTVVDSHEEGFSVAVIPYTWEHTNLGLLELGDRINVEFDVVGKYVARMLQNRS